jgi:hypothetical protein
MEEVIMKTRFKAAEIKRAAYRCEFCGWESNNQDGCCGKKMKNIISRRINKAAPEQSVGYTYARA